MSASSSAPGASGQLPARDAAVGGAAEQAALSREIREAPRVCGGHVKDGHRTSPVPSQQ
jgi:hypothetical protein